MHLRQPIVKLECHQWCDLFQALLFCAVVDGSQLSLEMVVGIISSDGLECDVVRPCDFIPDLEHYLELLHLVGEFPFQVSACHSPLTIVRTMGHQGLDLNLNCDAKLSSTSSAQSSEHILPVLVNFLIR